MQTGTSVDSLPSSTKTLIKDSVPVIKQHAVEIGTEFYKTMFTNYPAYRKQFNIDRQSGGVTKDHGAPAQIIAVTNSLISFGSNIESLSRIAPSMEVIFHKHVSRGVTAGQYPGVGESFLKAAKTVLGEGISQEILDAWGQGFAALAEIYIAKEDALRAELEARAGYSGLVEMNVGWIEDSDKGRRIRLGGVQMTGEFEGMYLSLYLAELETMMSAKIVGVSEEGLLVFVPNGKEKTSRYMLEKVQVGDQIKVSVPFGRKRK